MALLRRPTRGFTIRQWAAGLVAACLLPAVVASAVLIWSSYQRERHTLEQSTIELARALGQAIDRELVSGRGALDALATSPYLDEGRLAEFHRQARAVVADRPGSIIVLCDRTGQQLMNTRFPFGTPLPMHGDAPEIRRLFQTGKPVVSDVYRGATTRELLTSVDVPVGTPGAPGTVRYVLSMQFPSHPIADILRAQHIPSGRRATVLDRKGVIFARTHDAEDYAGRYARANLREALERAIEGSLWGPNREGLPYVSTFSRSPVSGWTVVIGMPQALVLGDLRRGIGWLVAGTLLLLALGLMLAAALGGGIAGSIRRLVAPAIALGYGKPVAIPALALREANDVARALEQAAELLRRRTAERDLAERTEQQLREAKRGIERSEAFLRGIFEQSPDAVFLVRPDGRVARANAEAERMFGCSQAELLASQIGALLFDPGQAEAPLKNHLLVPAAEGPPAVRHGARARRGDGTTFAVDLMVSPASIGEERLSIVTVRDMTERERGEMALRESEQRIRGVLEHAPIGIAEASLDGRLLEVNSALCELLGYSKEELRQLSSQALTHPDDLEAERKMCRRLLHGELRSYELEKRYLRRDGSLMPALLTGTVLRDARGRPSRFLALIQDISERRRAEERLASLGNRLLLATRAGGIAIWEWNFITGTAVWDQRMYQLYRVDPQEGQDLLEVWRSRAHPEDRERVEREREAAAASGGEYSTEFRIVLPGGEERVLQSNAIVSRDAAGKPLRMTGVSIDVTESRRRQQAAVRALREKETLLQELYHRVKNNLQVVNSMLNLQARNLPEGPAHAALAESAGRVRAMALVHEKLYQSENLSSISLQDYVADLCSRLGHAAAAGQRGIVLEVRVPPVEVGLETAVPLGLLLNELVSNSLKHAFPGGRSGHIGVQAERLDDERLRIEVSDDGIGFPDGSAPTFSASLGLKLVAALSRQLGGSLTIEDRNGVHASLTFRPESSADISSRAKE